MAYKIALLFLVDTDPNLPHVWDAYLHDRDSQVSVYIHPKRPELVTWRPECIIDALQPTAYGFITRAYRALLAAAMKDPLNIKFVFLSESCLPIVKFEHLYTELCAHPNESLVKRMPITKYDKGVARLGSVLGLVAAVGSKNIIKHYSRTCLSRMHARKVLTDMRVRWFDEMHVGDEFFLSGIQPTRGMKDMAVTEDDWDDTRDKMLEIRATVAALNPRNPNSVKVAAELWQKFENIASHPRMIKTLTERDKQRILVSRSFFYRKFSRGSNIDEFLDDIGIVSLFLKTDNSSDIGIDMQY